MHTIRGQWNSSKGVMEQELPPRWKKASSQGCQSVCPSVGLYNSQAFKQPVQKDAVEQDISAVNCWKLWIWENSSGTLKFIHIHINLETYQSVTLMDQTGKETDFMWYSCDFTLGRQFMVFQKGTKMPLQLEILQRTLVSIKFENMSLIWSGTLYRDFLLMFFHGLTNILLNVLYY